jgi:hypothetical protein
MLELGLVFVRPALIPTIAVTNINALALPFIEALSITLKLLNGPHVLATVRVCLKVIMFAPAHAGPAHVPGGPAGP